MLFSSVALSTFSAYAILLPKAEAYSQAALVEFFENAEPNSYKNVIDMKSYVPYFYGAVRPDGNPNSVYKHWLLEGEIDRPAYLASRIYRKDAIAKNHPQLEFLYEKNGYVFYKRKVAGKSGKD